MAALAHRGGIATPIAPVPASALGASVVRPLDYVAAYTRSANLGSAVEPRFVTRIEDATGKRRVRSAPPSAPQSVIDPRVAFIVRDMMRDVAERGTGAPARRAVPANVPVAGKTGTTNDNVDVWFMGMTPELVAGVWLGFDRPKTIAPGAAGGSLAAPIWGEMMAKYYAGPSGARRRGRRRSGWSPRSSTARPACSPTPSTPPERRYTEYFVPAPSPSRCAAFRGSSPCSAR